MTPSRIRRASVSQVNPAEAAADLYASLWQPDCSLVLLFVSPDYDRPRLRLFSAIFSKYHRCRLHHRRRNRGEWLSQPFDFGRELGGPRFLCGDAAYRVVGQF